ncbi:hypothetical protein LCGC14_0878090 [marine sediment metagenome]|uniref:Uncharacterized protein n=1 Tax=marine sediment metagenome TaxID=412755 RepID=A0A0F9PNC0_9ZZZZ
MTVDIKKVLAMPKWEQAEFLFQHTNQKPYEERRKGHWHALADAIDSHDAGSTTADHLLDMAMSLLAFRLRDEAKSSETSWELAQDYVYRAVHPSTTYLDDRTRLRWFVNETYPIHWTLTAMKAKENEDGE